MTQHAYSLSRLMTEAEVADYFGVSVKTLRRWRDAALIQCVKPPGDSRVVRFHRRQVQDCLQTMASGAGASPAAASAEPRVEAPPPIDDEVMAFQRAYELAQEIESHSSSARGKKGKGR